MKNVFVCLVLIIMGFGVMPQNVEAKFISPKCKKVYAQEDNLKRSLDKFQQETQKRLNKALSKTTYKHIEKTREKEFNKFKTQVNKKLKVLKREGC